jgi:hypothetical protein
MQDAKTALSTTALTLCFTRCGIAQYEDVVCGLSHETKRTHNLSPQMTADLAKILEKIPGHDYLLAPLAATTKLLFLIRIKPHSNYHQLGITLGVTHDFHRVKVG